MTFYTVDITDAVEGEVAVPTLKEALKLRAANAYPDGRIRRIKIARVTRGVLCAIFNREGFAAEYDIVKDGLPKREGEEA